MLASFSGFLSVAAATAVQHADAGHAAAAAAAGPHWGFTDQDMMRLLAVPLLPLFAYLIQIFIGRKLPRQGDWLLTGAMFCGLGLALYEFAKCLGAWSPDFQVSSRAMGLGWKFLSSTETSLGQPVPNVIAGILYDNLSAAMLVVVTLVSSLVHLFSMGYMHGDSRYNVFFANISLFSFAMLGLVLSDNLVFFFVFWELMGLCSYLLIGHFYYKDSARKACVKAFLTTRVGDTLLMIGLFILWNQFGTLSFTELYGKVEQLVVAEGGWPLWLTVAGLLVFCGTIGKSAQFPLHVWLPDAMEGPTPVSAMIHAATMVAAGVYLVGRAFPFLSPDARLVVALVGSFTGIFAATIGICANDIKKVLAYSTISQLGFMVAGIGVGGVSAGLFHMITHACFKACLFLGSGSVIHAVHTQDMREMGGLRKKMPVTYLTMLVSTLAIAGVPLFAGFYSKDAILAKAVERALLDGHWWYWLPVGFLFTAAGITAFYMFRLVHMTFHGEPRDREKFDHAHESGPTMAIPLIVLGFLAVICGYGYHHGIPNVWPEHGGWFQELWRDPVPHEIAHKLAGAHIHDAAHVEHVQHLAHNSAMMGSLAVAGLGILLSCAFYLWRKLDAAAWARTFGPVYTLVLNKYYVDEFYSKTAIAGTFLVSKVSSLFDKYVVDGVVNGVGRTMRGISGGSAAFDRVVVDGAVNFAGLGTQAVGSVLRLLQSGRIQQYVTLSVIGLVLLLAVLILR
ncbi:MAG: NADH-quinone oxidoreductase subunit L [Planctomycetes bacterium]|nr:NADH-quinone oxidoreductase subunit L [Planctomycetota bacterium]